MGKGAIRSAFPYFVGLAVAAILFVIARDIQYTPRPGILGPGVWPKMAIVLMAVVCLFEIVRRLAGGRIEASGIADIFEQDGDEESPSYPRTLAGGIALVSAFAVLVPVFGFLLATFLFLAAFMYVGRYRKHGAIWAISAIVTILIALLFVRFAYVSLPRGTPPFDQVTDFIRIILGG